MIIESMASDVVELEDAEPVVQNPARLDLNPTRMAKCLTRYDVKKNCVHIHD